MTPREQWDQLKARGNPTAAEIDAIDAATPWQEIEPSWWLEMMGVRSSLTLGKGHSQGKVLERNEQ